MFHSWSAQAPRPFVIAGGLGSTVWDHDGNQLARLLEPAREHQHRASASRGRRGDPGAGRHLATVAPPRQPGARRGRPAHPREGRRALRQGVLHQRRRGRERERDPHGAPHTGRDKVLSTYRSYHGNTGAADRRDRRLAPGAERVRPRARALLRPVPVPQRVLVGLAREESARALHHLERVIQVEGPSSIAAILLETCPAPPACSCRRPATSPACARCATSTASC